MEFEWSRVRNLLVMRLDNIGDVIMTGPALRALKNNLPQARLTLMVSPAGRQAVPLLPWVDKVITWRVLWQQLGNSKFDPDQEKELIRMLREQHFDAAIIFTSFSQSPHPAGLICRLAGIPLRLGESKETGNGALTTELKGTPDEFHQVERNLRLLEAIGFRVTNRRLNIVIPEGANQGAEQRLAKRGLTLQSSYILLSPWASCQARTYSPGRFVAAARDLSRNTGWPVVVTGAAKEREQHHALLTALGESVVDLVGTTTVPELAALIAHARLVLTNNSLPMHLADATGTPGLVTYSGTDLESQWQPRHSSYRLLRRPTLCSPCYAFTCPFNMQCLDIPAQEVTAAGLKLLNIV